MPSAFPWVFVFQPEFQIHLRYEKQYYMWFLNKGKGHIYERTSNIILFSIPVQIILKKTFPHSTDNGDWTVISIKLPITTLTILLRRPCMQSYFFSMWNSYSNLQWNSSAILSPFTQLYSTFLRSTFTFNTVNNSVLAGFFTILLTLFSNSLITMLDVTLWAEILPPFFHHRSLLEN